jgi:Ca-activated chloride channel family protein
MLAHALMLATTILAKQAVADGIIIPPPGVNMAVKYHKVTVTINQQVALTEIDQVFINDSEVDSLEAIYIFPIPKDATFTSFSMFVDDKELPAEVLDADSARAIYESIVRRNKDPALLEYVGLRLFRARIFPIRAGGEKRVKIAYTELLSYDNGVVKYLYPLSTEKFSSRPLELVRVAVSITSNDPIKSVYSPSHPLIVERVDDLHVNVLYEDESVIPSDDFLLFYTIDAGDVGMHLLPHRPAGEDGFFLLLAAPKQEISAEDVLPKRVIAVFDRSGSMTGEKIQQAREALVFVLNNLNDSDLFNIVDFSSDVRTYRNEPQEATSSNRADAVAYVRNIIAGGGTNINDALLRAMSMMVEDEFTNIVLFLTDGQPTTGVTDYQAIVRNVSTANTAGTRLFVFGVGYDVNTHLLDRLSGENSGLSTYVRPGENIEEAVSSLFTKISSPVLSDLQLDFGSISVYDQFPQQLPDLFQGSQLSVFGRYQNVGATTITLSGSRKDSTLTYSLEATFPEEDDAFPFVARLWAVRKVGYLLDQIRLNGETPELVDEIVALSKKYAIITPYTSFLILEDQAQPGAFSNLSAESGKSAVDAAANIGSYRGAVTWQSVQVKEARYIGGKAFFLRNGYWIDTAYDETLPVTEIIFGTEQYFDFVSAHPEFSKYLSLGKNVAFSVDGRSYRIHEEGVEWTPIYPTVPENFRLHQNYPNPFNPGTRILYQVGRTARVSIRIYNLRGELVRTLVDAVHRANTYWVFWDGRAQSGQRVPAGIYFYELRVDGRRAAAKKMTLLR